MATTRFVSPSELFVRNVAALTRDSPSERVAVLDACERLETDAEDGELFDYEGYPGPHYNIPVGRFLIVYQFSRTEVRLKDFLIKEDA